MHKRKHHKKQKIVRDPEQIKELRLQRLNIKREVCWDARFIKETIPDFFALKQRPKKVDKLARGRTPLQSVYVEKEKPKIIDIQPQKMRETVSTHKRKSFKIRTIKKEVDSNKQKVTVPEKQVVLQKQNEKQIKKARKLKNKQKLIEKLEQKSKLNPINVKYKELLLDIIQKSCHKRHKNVRVTVQKQIDSIGTENNVYKRLEKLVQARRKILKQINEKKQEANLKDCIDYQMLSLQLIQQILKFKAFWQSIYTDNLRRPTRVNFYYENDNCLAEISKESENFTQKDPFLIERTANLLKNSSHVTTQEQNKQRKEMMLKIRACELLLIEEELLATQ